MKRLHDILSDEISFFPKNISEIMKISYIWSKIIGPILSDVTKPIKLINNKLYVGVFDNIVLQEVSFKKTNILEELKNYNIYIEDIIFKIVHFDFQEITNQKTKKGIINVEPHKTSGFVGTPKEIINKFSNVIKDANIREHYVKALTAFLEYTEEK